MRFTRAALLAVILSLLAPACSGEGRDPAPPDSQGAADASRRPADGGGFSAPDWQQTLPDMNENGITEWTSGTQQQVTVGGVTYTAWQLLTPDPFVKTWQLEDGTIVVSNEPLASLVTPNAMSLMQAQTPATTSWAPPGGTVADVYADELIVWFKPEATQADIEDIIAAKSLHVIMSWFEPKDDFTPGNELAWFEFQLSGSVFSDLTDMYGYFSGHALVAGVEGNECNAFTQAWSNSGNPQPNDMWGSSYMKSGWAYALNVDDANVPVSYAAGGPQDFSNQVVCVMDDGVDRRHKDLFTTGTNAYSKVTAVGVNTQPKAYWVGTYVSGNPQKDFGQPDYTQLNGLASHGTEVAGVIAAATHNGEGVACLAPRARVMPIRLYKDPPNANGLRGFSDAAISKALRCLMFEFRSGAYGFDLRVVNMSFSNPKMPPWGFLIDRDLKPGHNDRLYLGCAGNEGSQVKTYPACFANVLGVTGMQINLDDNHNYNIDSTESYTQQPSNYWDASVYQVSGPYLVFESDLIPDLRDVGYTLIARATSIPLGGGYERDHGTSFSCPCIAALAFHLYDKKGGNTNYAAVRNRIINTRGPNQTFGNAAFAGIANFKSALGTGW